MTDRINGKTKQTLPLLDRGLLYGHSVFETIAVEAQQALLLDHHIDRLRMGCERLSIPLDEATLLEEIDAACHELQAGVLRVTITAGEGGRGYRTPEPVLPNRILTSHPLPAEIGTARTEGIVLGLCRLRLAQQPALAGIKHGNRLEQVLARSEWHDDWQEALMLDQNDNVIEGTQSNVFVIDGQELQTPLLDQAGIDGVMRRYLLENAHRVGLKATAVRLSLGQVNDADEVFMCNSLIGLWPVRQFGKKYFDGYKSSLSLLEMMRRDGVIPTI